MISDGEDHQGGVLEKAEEAAKKGIIVYAVGIGTPEGGPIPVYTNDVLTGFKKDREGTTVITSSMIQCWKKLHRSGKGMYVTVDKLRRRLAESL